MQTVLQQVRFSVRQLRKSPAFAITTILTLGLGIGATTAIFSLVNAVVLRPLPFPEQERLVWAQQADQTLSGVTKNQGVSEPLSYPDFFDWRSQSHSFTAIACYRSNDVTFTGTGPAKHLPSDVVSADFFRALGVRPVLGRDFRLDEEKPGSRVAVLSYQMWRSEFGSAPDILGRSITLGGNEYSVAGVMPADFAFPLQNPPVALWTTLADDAVADSSGGTPMAQQRGADMLGVIARLKPGVSLAQAQTELSLITRRLAAQYPDTNKPYTAAIVQPELEHLIGNSRPAMQVLFAAVTFVLLIACANVAGLLLARMSRRHSEIALRVSLGASRGEIIRQVLVESIVLSLCGGVLGVAFSSGILRGLVRFVPRNLPRIDQISVDGTVLLFVTAVSLLTGILFGVLPAVRMSRFEPSSALREGSRGITSGRGQNRLHCALVVAETAIGLVLLIGSGLLIRSFIHVLGVNPGFDAQHVLTASLALPDTRYTSRQKVQFYNQLLSSLAALPGVQSAAAGWPLPLSGTRIGISFQIEGHPTAPGDAPSEALSIVTPDYFRALRIPVLSGRAFTPRDDVKSTPVIIVNEKFARKYFPGQNPIGKHVKSDLGDGTVKAPVREVVGVVGDVKSTKLTAEIDPQYYLPWPQAVITSPTLCIRTSGDPVSLIGALRANLSAMDRNIPLYQVGNLEDSVYRAAAQPRFQTVLLTSFALLALLLSAVGLYAVLSYMVVQRTVEIGVRMAVGAQRKDILNLILRRGFSLALIGVAIGVAISVLLTRFMTGMLYGIQPLDPATFTAVGAVLLTVSLVASSAPAFRAAWLDPMKTLRDQ